MPAFLQGSQTMVFSAPTTAHPLHELSLPRGGKHWMKPRLVPLEEGDNQIALLIKVELSSNGSQKDGLMALQENRAGAQGGRRPASQLRHGRPQPQGSSPPHSLPGDAPPQAHHRCCSAALRSQDRPALPPTHLWGCRPLCRVSECSGHHH